MKKYLTNKQAHDEVINGPYINKNFKTAEEIEGQIQNQYLEKLDVNGIVIPDLFKFFQACFFFK